MKRRYLKKQMRKKNEELTIRTSSRLHRPPDRLIDSC